MSSLQEVYGDFTDNTVKIDEKAENPQMYDYIATTYIHPEPRRHILGIVGGNEVSLIKGNMVDLESDLRGINIPNTFCPWRQYQAPTVPHPKEIVRNNTKIRLSIDTAPKHLPAYQMWAYPAVAAPLPIVSQTCRNPEKY